LRAGRLPLLEGVPTGRRIAAVSGTLGRLIAGPFFAGTRNTLNPSACAALRARCTTTGADPNYRQRRAPRGFGWQSAIACCVRALVSAANGVTPFSATESQTLPDALAPCPTPSLR